MDAGDDDHGVACAVNGTEIRGVGVGADDDELLRTLRRVAIDGNVDVTGSGGRRDIGKVDFRVGNNCVRSGRRNGSVEIRAECGGMKAAGGEAVAEDFD